MDLLPEEILRYVLLMLPGKDLVRCRQVSKVWKKVVDDCTKSDEFWKGCCAAEYYQVYSEAKRKALPSLTWRELYKSLSVWSIFDESRVVQVWKAPYCVIGVENGVVIMRKEKIVKVVDANKKKVDRGIPLYGYIFKYYENENFIAAMRDHCTTPSLEIFVKEENKVGDIIFEIIDVKDCICVKNTIYYAKYGSGVYRYDFNGHNFDENQHKLLFEVDDVIALSYKDNYVIAIHSRTGDSTMTLYDEETETVTQQNLRKGEDIFQKLMDYDFTKYMVEENWKNMNETMADNLQGTYNTLKQHNRDFYIITSFKQYGDTVFVGSDMGYLFIFRNPYRNGKIDFNKKPVMIIRRRGHVYYIDAVESKSGPILILSMDEYVFAFKLTCGIKMKKNVAAKTSSLSTCCTGAKRKRL